MIWSALILPAAVALLFLRYFRAMRFLREQQKAAAAHVIIPEEKMVPQAGVNVRVYPSKNANATLVLVPGLHPDGVYDRRAQTLAASCAHAGFQVVAVDIPEFRTFHITNDGVQSIAALIKALPDHFPASTLKKIGVLGVSYGFGPVVMAAARKDLVPRVDFLISIGGYYDLHHALEYALTGIHDHDGFQQRSTPEPWARMIFTLIHLDELVSDKTDIPPLKESLLLRLNSKEDEARAVDTHLSASGRSFLEKVLRGMTAETLDGFGPLLTRLKPELWALSPASVLSMLRPELRLHLLHGRTDELVPSVETTELDAALRKLGHRHVNALVTDQLGHVDMGGASNVLDFVRLICWTRSVLSESS